MYQNGVILPDGILRQKDKSIAIFGKGPGKGLEKNRPCELKNKSPRGLGLRDKKPGQQE